VINVLAGAFREYSNRYWEEYPRSTLNNGKPGSEKHLKAKRRNKSDRL
jgi:hypothetical protein